MNKSTSLITSFRDYSLLPTPFPSEGKQREPNGFPSWIRVRGSHIRYVPVGWGDVSPNRVGKAGEMGRDLVISRCNFDRSWSFRLRCGFYGRFWNEGSCENGVCHRWLFLDFLRRVPPRSTSRGIGSTNRDRCWKGDRTRGNGGDEDRWQGAFPRKDLTDEAKERDRKPSLFWSFAFPPPFPSTLFFVFLQIDDLPRPPSHHYIPCNPYIRHILPPHVFDYTKEESAGDGCHRDMEPTHHALTIYLVYGVIILELHCY